MPISAPSFAIRFAYAPQFGQRVIELDFGGSNFQVPELMVLDLGEVVKTRFWRQRLRANDMSRVASVVREWLRETIEAGRLYLDRVRGHWRYTP
jgi:hypothetical protein